MRRHVRKTIERDISRHYQKSLKKRRFREQNLDLVSPNRDVIGDIIPISNESDIEQILRKIMQS